MKTFTKTLIATAILTTGAAVQADVSASLGVASNYLFRGSDLSAGSAAVSGSIDYAHDLGFYAGIWGTSGDDSYGTEYDVYVGFANETSGGLGYDIGYLDYNYPNCEAGQVVAARGSCDFEEVYGGLSYDNVSLYVYNNVDGGFNETYAALGVGLGAFDVTLGLFSDDGGHLDVTYSSGDLAFTLSQADGDVFDPDNQEFADNGGSFAGDELQFVVSYSLSFDL